MNDSAPILRLAGVSKSYPASAEEDVDVLHGIDLDVSRGESLAVMGPSGSGKSTLLNIIGALDRPSTGTVELDGRDVVDCDDTELARIRNSEIGFIFQLHYLLPQCTIMENVLVPTLVNDDRAGAQQYAREMLEQVGLSHRLAHRPGQLSGGERQRVAVVRALINRPKLLLADEPTGSLDRVASECLGDLLVRLNAEQKVTLIVVTHSQSLAERAGRVLELRDGRLVD